MEFEFDLLVDTATNVAAEMVCCCAWSGSWHSLPCAPLVMLLLLPYYWALPLPAYPAPHKPALRCCMHMHALIMTDLLFLASRCPVQVSDLELTPDDAAVIASTIRAELARLSDLPEVRTAVVCAALGWLNQA